MAIAAAAGAATFHAEKAVRSAENEQPPLEIIDTNASLFQWPFRRLPLDETNALVKKLRSLGITQAWAGSFEGLLHRDLAGVNQRLAEECKRRMELLPMGSVNPQLLGWERDLKDCIEEHNMPGIRLHPNYHGYTLDDPRFARLLEQATKARLLVQISVAMEDTRTQHPRLAVPDVDLSPLPGVLSKIPWAKVQILNYRPQPAMLDKLAKTPGVYFDVARVESTDGVPKLVAAVPEGRVLFGTHAPFLVPEAALIRTHEASLLYEESLRELLSANARAVLEGRA
jgi:predicted TIM-barrel fold metal-dependent hydrolase